MDVRVLMHHKIKDHSSTAGFRVWAADCAPWFQSWLSPPALASPDTGARILSLSPTCVFQYQSLPAGGGKRKQMQIHDRCFSKWGFLTLGKELVPKATSCLMSSQYDSWVQEIWGRAPSSYNCQCFSRKGRQAATARGTWCLLCIRKVNCSEAGLVAFRRPNLNEHWWQNYIGILGMTT